MIRVAGGCHLLSTRPYRVAGTARGWACVVGAADIKAATGPHVAIGGRLCFSKRRRRATSSGWEQRHEQAKARRTACRPLKRLTLAGLSGLESVGRLYVG